MNKLKNLTRKYILGLNLNDNRKIHIGIVDLMGNVVVKKSHKLNVLNIYDNEYYDKVIASRIKEVF
jgi:hypothetical protein